MGNFEIFIFLMTMSILLIEVAQRIGIPYPIALVLGGAAISFIPGLKPINFDPNLILIVVLPPILFYSAFWISPRQFKSNFREILSLALGLVIATTVVVAIVFKWLFPDLPWALALAFGAIISPPDAASATAILKKFSISSRLLNVLEGESLINDASGIVLYKISLAVLLANELTVKHLGGEFVLSILGGIALGILIGYSIQVFSRKFLRPMIGATFSFAIPYVTYALADLLNFSGVLAVVVCGIISSHFVLRYQFSQRRVIAFPAWDIFIVLMNCFVFMLIGTQLRGIAKEMTGDQIILYTAYGLLIMAIMILVRVLWINLYNGVFCLKTLKNYKHSALFRESAILAWSGMRGIVSLSLALSLPYFLRDSVPLEGRSIVIFITFIVILLTLIIPGLTLPVVIKWLNINPSPLEVVGLQETREMLAKLARKKIEHLHSSGDIDVKDRDFLITYFCTHHRVLQASSSHHTDLQPIEVARLKVLQAQREYLIKLGEKGEIEERLLGHLEHELDIEETHFARGHGV